MSTDFYAKAISKYADASVQPMQAANGAEGGKPEAPTPKIDKYLVLFTVKRASLAISYHPDALRDLKKGDLVSRTYGEGDNFRWVTLVAFITIGDKEGAIVLDMTSDGRRGSSAKVIGSLGMDASTLLAHLKDQGVPFPFQEGSSRLFYERLGDNYGYFADVSGSNGNLDTSKKDALTSSSMLTHVDRVISESMGLNAFRRDYDNDSFRTYNADTNSNKLFRINGKEDGISTNLVKKILSQADEPAQPTGGQSGGQQAFQPQGPGQKGTDRFADGGMLNPDNVQELNEGLERTKKSLDEINDVVNGKSASDLRHMVSSLLIKVSKI
jgi:hypothetical protein